MGALYHGDPLLSAMYKVSLGFCSLAEKKAAIGFSYEDGGPSAPQLPAKDKAKDEDSGEDSDMDELDLGWLRLGSDLSKCAFV